jgi:hypothetical protein
MEKNVGLLKGDMSNISIEMRTLRWIFDHTRRDHVWNDDIHKRLGVAPVKKLVQHYLKWFEHIQRKPTKAPVHSGVIRQTGNWRRGRQNLT